MDKNIAFTLLYVLTLFVFAAYVKNSKEVVELDGVRFRYTGMAQLPVGEDIYTPVYKRLK